METYIEVEVQLHDSWIMASMEVSSQLVPWPL
jgi:hypothetical protein